MKISVVIPAYNAEKTIKRCLESVLAQEKTENFNIEIIVVNDAATDGTSNIISQYPVRQVVLDKNSGPAAARNQGIKESTGDIIVFIDSDVEFKDSDSLLKIQQIFDSRSEIAGIIMVKDKKPLNSGLIPRYWALYKYYLWNMPGEFQSSFTTERSAVRREIFDKIGYFNDKYKKADVEDFEFGYRLNNSGFKILIARDIKVLHHFETFSQSIKKTFKRSWQWIRLFIHRKRFDPVYSSKERGIKTLVAATIPLLVIVAMFWHEIIYLLVLVVSIYLVYNLGFYFFLIRERQARWLVPFLLLDIIFCTLTIIGASSSLIGYYVIKKNE